MPLTKVTYSMIDGGTVNVNDFGAVGDGIADDTVAIQAAIDTGKDVIFPSNNYKITATLKVGSQRLIGQGYAPNRSRRQTQITVIGNIAAFENKTDWWTSLHIEGFFIYFSDNTPTDPVADGQKTGFNFATASGKYPEYSYIANCTILGAWQGIVDTTNAYKTQFNQVACRKTKRGFYKRNGTTLQLNTCSSADGDQAFNIGYCLGVQMLNCSNDNLNVTTSTFDQCGNKFDHIPSLVISNYDAEVNKVTGAGTRLFFFDTVYGAIDGFTGVLNELSCTSGEEVSFFNVTASSYVRFSAIKLDYDTDWLKFTGNGGTCYTLSSSGFCNITLTNSNFAAPTGGTPTSRYSVGAFTGSSISLIDTFTDNLVDGIGFSTKSGKTKVCTGTWDNGPMLMGNYYLWVDGAGKLRIKNGAPSSDLDGVVVGTQT